jgi:hypothetical protein
VNVTAAFGCFSAVVAASGVEPVNAACGRSAARPGAYAFGMHTVELTDEELRIVREALHSYLDDFGHEEADILQLLKAILAKLPEPE